jgi:DNA mismatch repair protein MutL
MNQSRIHRLDPGVVNKIAAGEVIERPASVVKELLENSLDALASRIEVDIVKGGSELIRIADDGEGIHKDDLSLAVTSHATSKIVSDEDLFRVQTMGFRGEALASIASVSRFLIRSRVADEESGYELEVNAGVAGSIQACGCPPGTVSEVRQLFLNTPVRRKFLKTPGTEFGHISEQFTRIALSNPRLHAVLRHNGKTVYELPPTDRLLDRLTLFYGSELTETLIPIDSESDGIRLWGYAGHPSQSKSTRKGQYLFLNGRWIQDRSLQHALKEAYRGLLMVGRYPIAFLFLEIPSELVDVNVHPTKSEVRFRDSQQLYRHLLSALRSKFLGMDLNSTLSLPPGTNPDLHASTLNPRHEKELQIEFAGWAKDKLADWQPTNPPAVSIPESEFPDEAPAGSFPVNDEHETGPENSLRTEKETFSSATDEMRRDDPAAPPRPHDGGSQIMQVHDCYLVLETEEGLTVIDQHALHERVLYEQLRQRVLNEAVESQRMLVPETVELDPAEAMLIVEHRDLFAQLGFGIEEFGGNTVLLTGYPPMLSRVDLGRLIRDLAGQLAEAGPTPTRRDLLDRLLHMMSCKAAIKSGDRLSQEEMESLLAQRHLVDDAHHCPHGRPTALVLSRAELDRQFGRLG